jgi:hypothetical protein
MVSGVESALVWSAAQAGAATSNNGSIHLSNGETMSGLTVARLARSTKTATAAKYDWSRLFIIVLGAAAMEDEHGNRLNIDNRDLRREKTVNAIARRTKKCHNYRTDPFT